MGPTLTIGHHTPDGQVVHQITIPQLGLGVFLMGKAGECTQACLWALKAGYRHIDTAMAYENEHEVGVALAQCGIPREEIFVTTKLRRPHAVGFEEVQKRCRQSLENLGLDYVDLYLVHAPPEDLAHREPTWKGMEACLDNGWTKAIGVSNYGAHHLEAMKSYAKYLPAVNQIEVNPWLQRAELRAMNAEIGAVTMAYSPLARGHKIADENVVAIAARIGCSPAQVAIKWCVDQGCITIPKSSDKGRISENLASLGYDLSSEHSALKKLDENYISGWDPTTDA
jgi:diketogulonate reductase-like aldo/keto reductase